MVLRMYSLFLLIFFASSLNESMRECEAHQSHVCFCNRKSAKIPKEFSTFSKTSIYLLFNHLMVHRRKPKSPINLSSIDQVTEMNNSVDHGCSKLLVSNDLPPFAERKVCRQYQTLVLIAVGNHLEHQFGTHLVQLAIAPFVNDEKIQGQEPSLSAPSPSPPAALWQAGRE